LSLEENILNYAHLYTHRNRRNIKFTHKLILTVSSSQNTKSGFLSLTLHYHIYRLAKERADRDGIKVAQLLEKAIPMYIDRRLQLDEKAKIIAKMLGEMEKGKVII